MTPPPEVFPCVAHPRLINSSTRHGDAILRRVCQFGPVVGVEVGVCRGVLSEHLLSRRPDLTLHMVDWWQAHDTAPASPGSEAIRWSEQHNEPCNTQTGEQVHDNYEAAQRIAAQFPGRAVIHRQTSIEAAKNFRGNFRGASVDFVFIDADHRYESVVADIAAWLPKIKPGGWIGGHDYGLPEFDGSVDRAVNEFAQQHKITLQLGDFFTWFTPPDPEFLPRPRKPVFGSRQCRKPNRVPSKRGQS